MVGIYKNYNQVMLTLTTDQVTLILTTDHHVHPHREV